MPTVHSIPYSAVSPPSRQCDCCGARYQSGFIRELPAENYCASCDHDRFTELFALQEDMWEQQQSNQANSEWIAMHSWGRFRDYVEDMDL